MIDFSTENAYIRMIIRALGARVVYALNEPGIMGAYSMLHDSDYVEKYFEVLLADLIQYIIFLDIGAAFDNHNQVKLSLDVMKKDGFFPTVSMNDIMKWRESRRNRGLYSLYDLHKNLQEQVERGEIKHPFLEIDEDGYNGDSPYEHAVFLPNLNNFNENRCAIIIKYLFDINCLLYTQLNAEFESESLSIPFGFINDTLTEIITLISQGKPFLVKEPTFLPSYVPPPIDLLDLLDDLPCEASPC